MKQTRRNVIRPWAATVALLGAIGLGACSTGTSQVSSMTSAMSAFGGVANASTARPTKQDLAKSCSTINAELQGLYAQMEKINAAERSRERQQSLTNGLMNAGLSVVGAGAMMNAGSAQALSNIGAATNVAGTAASSAIGGSGPDQQTVNQATAIAQKSARLERAKLEKGC